VPLKGSVTRFFASGFLHESPSPKPLKVTLGSFRFFRKFAEIFTSQGAPPLSTTPVANLPPMSRTPAANLPPVSTIVHWWQICQRCQLHRWQILPPVSTTLAANFATGTYGVVYTGGKFATGVGVNDTGGNSAGVNDTCGILPPVSTTPAANLPRVSTKLVANSGNNIRLQTP
jgi:hypothetical protein